MEVHKPDGEVVDLSPRVTALVDRRELSWGGGIRWLFWGNHSFILGPLADGSTRLLHTEVFTGMVPRWVPLHGIEEGYRGMNDALKRYLENDRDQ